MDQKGPSLSARALQSNSQLSQSNPTPPIPHVCPSVHPPLSVHLPLRPLLSRSVTIRLSFLGLSSPFHPPSPPPSPSPLLSPHPFFRCHLAWLWFLFTYQPLNLNYSEILGWLSTHFPHPSYLSVKRLELSYNFRSIWGLYVNILCYSCHWSSIFQLANFWIHWWEHSDIFKKCTNDNIMPFVRKRMLFFKPV